MSVYGGGVGGVRGNKSESDTTRHNQSKNSKIVGQNLSFSQIAQPHRLVCRKTLLFFPVQLHFSYFQLQPGFSDN